MHLLDDLSSFLKTSHVMTEKRQSVFDALEDEPFPVLQGLRRQEDRSLPHNGRIVTEILNRTFANQWIGFRGFVNWSPRSPDLNPLDYFLWGYVKNR